MNRRYKTEYKNFPKYLRRLKANQAKYMRKENNFLNLNLKTMLKMFFGIVALLFLPILIISIYTSLTRIFFDKPDAKLFGLSTSVVSSGSMSPALNVGDILVTHSKNTYKIGDIITYLDTENSQITHRIKSTDINGNFITQGDANDMNDTSSVTYSQIIGSVSMRYPVAGKIFLLIRTPLGLLMMILLAALLLFVKYWDLPFFIIWIRSYIKKIYKVFFLLLPTMPVICYLLIMTSVLISLSYSRYSTNVQASNTEGVAKFDVSVTHPSWNGNEYKDGSYNNAEGSKTYTFSVTNNSEVPLRLRLVVDSSDYSVSVNPSGWFYLSKSASRNVTVTVAQGVGILGNDARVHFEYEQQDSTH